MVIRDKVYDLTDFIEYHPGGQELMLEYAGTDATTVFFEKPHTVDANKMLERYYIGELVRVKIFL
jgi:cytochrome b5